MDEESGIPAGDPSWRAQCAASLTKHNTLNVFFSFCAIISFSETSCEDEEQIGEILAKVKESADVHIEKIEQTIRRGASLNEVVQELYTMCDDEDTSPSAISAIHSATESKPCRIAQV